MLREHCLPRRFWNMREIDDAGWGQVDAMQAGSR
jgi:hypothetical protein